MWAILTSKLGLAGIALTLILGTIGIQRLMIHNRDQTIATQAVELKTAATTINTQNAAIAAQSAKSSAALSGAAKQVAAVAPRADHFASQAASLGVYKPQGADRCSMVEDAVLEARKLFQ
jgi:hypothetical protein